MPSNTPTNTESPRTRARTISGVVVSDKMNKTRIIEVRHSVKHSLYAKSLVRATRLFVHDEKNVSKVGDTVIAVSSRPLSRHKNFRLMKVVDKKVQG